jgi:hypothetical protein
MNNIPNSKSGRVKPHSDEDIVHEYFRLIRTKDIYRLLELLQQTQDTKTSIALLKLADQRLGTLIQLIQPTLV